MIAKYLLALTFLPFAACAPALGPVNRSESPAVMVKGLTGDRIAVVDLDRFVRTQMDSLAIPGLTVALINDGKVAFHRAFGIANLDSKTRVDTATIFEAASLTKTVFAYLTMQMVDKGLLTLDTPLYQLAPLQKKWWGFEDVKDDERLKRITARQVLSHTTGFPNWREDNQGQKLDIKFTPGTQFSYSGEGYELLADVLAHLNNTDLDGLNSIFLREVAQPMGMTRSSFSVDSALFARKADGHKDGKVLGRDWCCKLRHFLAAGGLHTEASSYARFLIAFMNGKGLSKRNMMEMLRPQIVIPADHQRRREQGITGWGLGIAIEALPNRTFYQHGGTHSGYRSYFLIDVREKNGYVFIINSNNSNNGGEFGNRLKQYLTGRR